MLSAVSLRQRAQPVDLGVLIAGVAAWAAGAAVSFRSVLLSSFDFVFGDRGDGRLIIYLHEHWFNVLHGRAQFLSPPFFYPQKDVLGFSDALLLDAAPYAALRSIGLDPFLSFQIWAMALSFCCFLASLVICRRYLRLGFGIAICAAALMTFPNNLMWATIAGHSNFFGLYYVPCIVLLALWGVEDFPQTTGWSLLRVGMAAALFGLLFSTAYYIAWMSAFTALIALCILAIMLRRDLLAAARKFYRPARPLIGVAILGFAVGLIPLPIIYFPVLSIFSGRTFAEYLFYASFPKDVIDVSVWNMAWGWLVERLIGDAGSERTLAVTPGMTLIFLVLAYRFRNGIGKISGRPWQPIFFVVCALVWDVSWLFTLRIGTFSLFWLPYHVLPGATAIRVGGRVQFLTNLWVVTGLAVILQYWIDGATGAVRRHRGLIASIVLILCLIEQINLMPDGLSRGHEFAWLAAVPNPPPQCQVFLVRPTEAADYLDEDDALWISLKTGLPTINGYSGWFPIGWHLSDSNMGYYDAARRWIGERGVQNQVCLYDKTARNWSKFH